MHLFEEQKEQEAIERIQKFAKMKVLRNEHRIRNLRYMWQGNYT